MLTKITNRMGYDEMLDKLCALAEQNPPRAALIFMDLDGFKKINDVYSHVAGDAVLTAVADELLTHFRSVGTPARFGGDEFAIIVDRFDSKSQLECAVRSVLSAIEEIGYAKGYALSASVGIFYFSANLPTTRKFAATAADALLYLAKNSGKNQFKTSTNRTFDHDGKLISEQVVDAEIAHT